MRYIPGKGWVRTGLQLLLLGGVVYIASKVLTKMTGGISNALPL
jgi:hypothetical protein